MVMVGVSSPSDSHAKANLDFSAMTRSLDALGVREAGALVRAVDAFSKERNVEASLHLKAALLANGILEPKHGHAVVEALQTAVGSQGRETEELVERFVGAYLPSARRIPTSGTFFISGIITEQAYRQMKSSGGLADVPRGTGYVFLHVVPSDATVSIDGKKYSGSPISVSDVEAGYQKIRVEKRGYGTMSGYIHVAPMKVARAHVGLSMESTALTVTSEPTGATVFVDGQRVGNTPLTVEDLSRGTHKITMSSPGYSWSGEVSVGPVSAPLHATLNATPRARPTSVAVVSTPAPVVRNNATSPGGAGAVSARPPATPRSAAPSGGAIGGSGGVDLRSLSPDLQKMAWEQLLGKTVAVEVKGRKANVRVVEVRNGGVVLQPPGRAKVLIPMKDISNVRE